MPEAQIAVELTQAQLQLANKQWEQALATLRHLQDIAPKHPYVLKLLMALYQEIKDWPQLIKLLPDLKKHQLLTETEFDRLTVQAYSENLKDLIKQHQAEQINLLINTLPKNIKYHPEIIIPYCEYLIQSEQLKKAEGLLRDCLKKQFHPHFISLYGQLTANPNEQLQFAQTFLKKQPHSAELLLCVARLCVANQLWGQAKIYLDQSIRLQPTPAAYAVLGHLHEQLNEPLEACAAYRTGLLSLTKL
jgi:HemY protein